MSNISVQIAAITARLSSVEARQISTNPNDILYSYIGESVLYGCKVTEGVDSSDMTVALEALAAGDEAHWNPDYSATPVRPYQYGNRAAGKDGAFSSNDLTADVDVAPATGLSRYDIAYIYVGPSGAAFAIASGTPSIAVKTAFDSDGMDTSTYPSGSGFDPDLPIGALPVGRIYVNDATVGIPNAHIADLRDTSGTHFGSMALQNSNAVSISGGSMDGVSIGALMPSTGAFTSLAASGIVTFSNTMDAVVASNGPEGAVNIAGGLVVAKNIIAGGLIVTAMALTTLGVTGVASFADGLVGTPSITFTSDADTGLYRVSANVLGLTAQGADVLRLTNPVSAVNYMQNSGSATGTALTRSAAGSDTDISLVDVMKGVGTYSVATGGSATNIQLRVGHAASAVNHIYLRGSATGNSGLITVEGSDSNIILYLSSKGTSNVAFATGGGQQFTVVNTNAAVNYVQVQGAATGSAAGFNLAGTDTNINFFINSKGTGAVGFSTGGGYQFEVGNVATTVNYLRATGAATGGAPGLFALGSDVTINLGYRTKALGSHFFYSSGGSSVQFAIGATSASAVNYITAFGNATGAGPSLSATGSDANINFNYAAKGTGAHAFYTGAFSYLQLLVSNTTSAVNYWSFTGATTGNAISMVVAGSDSNIGAAYSSKGTGGHSFYTNGSFSANQFAIIHTASAVNYWAFTGSATGNSIKTTATGTDSNIGITFIAKGTSGYLFQTAGGTTQVAITDTASAVNYISLTGSTTGTPLDVSAAGTDTDINLNLAAKGNATISFYCNSVRGLAVTAPVSGVNRIQISGVTTGNSPIVEAVGSDSNISLNFQVKVSGVFKFSKSSGGAIELNSTGTSMNFSANTAGVIQLQVLYTASAVNNLTITGAVTTAYPILASTGSDSNVGMNFSTKGTGIFNFSTSTGTTNIQAKILHVASAVNYATIIGGATGNKIEFGAAGANTDIDLGLTPKGAGVLDIAGTPAVAIAIASTHKFTVKIGGSTYYLLASNV